jgi:hypothetical protein
MELPLIRMDPDDHFRFMIAVMFCVLPIFPMTAMFSALPMPREDAADSGEQGGDAY